MGAGKCCSHHLSRIFDNQGATRLSFLRHSCPKAFWVGLGAGCSRCAGTGNGGRAGVPLRGASAQTYSWWRDRTSSQAAMEEVTAEETRSSVALVSAWFYSQLCSAAPSSRPRRAGRCPGVGEAPLRRGAVGSAGRGWAPGVGQGSGPGAAAK